MNVIPKKKRAIGVSFLIYLGAFGVGINLFLNDKMRAEMESVIKSGRKKEEMKIIHDRIAPSYEKKTEGLEIRCQFNKYRRILVSYATGKVLECGIGTGRSLEFYKKDAELVGIDYSPKMLEIAKNKLEDKEVNNINKSLKVDITTMDCEDIKENFSEGLFDCVVDINNFHSYNDYMKVYQGIKFVLKDQGLFLFMARGQSDWLIIRDFYKMFKPYVFIKYAQDLTIDWSQLIENDEDWEILFKARKNYGKTFIYVLKYNKSKAELI